MRQTSILTVPLLGGLAGVLSACSGPAPSPHTAESVSSRASGATTSSTPNSPSTSTTTSTSEAIGASMPCANAAVAVTSSGGGAGLGHEDQVLIFENTSGTTCMLSGYPGIAALDSAGQQVAQARRTVNGYLGGLSPGAKIPVIMLGPNQSASAIVEGTDNPVGTATTCPYYASLLVTPPGLTRSTRVTVSGLGRAQDGLPGCSGLEVHPVVTGTSGSSAGF